MATPYPIPSGRTRVHTRASNSRFIATLAPAAAVDGAKDFIESIRQEMPDATHHVYAYRVGHGSSVTEGMSDDGEPSGTSGPPVLAVLRGAELGDVVLVVTRYFGGTKLGTGGLVAAYGAAAKEAVAQARTELKIERRMIRICVDYAQHGGAVRILESAGAVDLQQEYGASVTLRARLPLAALEEAFAQVRNLTSGQAELQVLE